MHILAINAGSSSLKSSIVEHQSGQRLASATVERIGEAEPSIRTDGGSGQPCRAATHAEAFDLVLQHLLARLPEGASLRAVGHRVVHGGEAFKRPVIIDEEVERTIEGLFDLAPLHNPPNLEGIRAARRALPDLPHVAVFDTAFHATLPRRARMYALPRELSERLGIRRYGFHGISHGYVAREAARYLGEDLRDLRVITCHLGNGCSMAAVEYGRSAETSMGMTPLEGLVMGTRIGDLDPGVALHLMRKDGLDVEGLDDLLNRSSGLKGLSGVSNDMRDIEQRAAEGDDACRLAIQVFAHRVRKYVGAYAAVMGGVDAIVFTAGIGENSAMLRHRIAQRLGFLGARLDEDRNRNARVDHAAPVCDLSSPQSRVKLLVIKTDEQRAIARDAAKVVLELSRTRGSRAIPVAISARHMHLTQETIEALFGSGRTLTVRNPLSQPGQFAAEETVEVVGPKRSIEHVRILGPARSKNQVEISRTDEFHLGLDAPVRGSGDIENTPGCTLVGPAGKVELRQGVICAWRHIHMTPDDAEALGVKDRDVVEVAIDSDGRNLVFGDVLVRVSPKYKLEMHLDTDEGNAAELSRHSEGMLMGTPGTASLRHRATKYDEVEGGAQP